LKYFLTCSATVYVVVNKYINKTQIYLQVLFGSDIDHYKKKSSIIFYILIKILPDSVLPKCSIRLNLN
jgi:hypothetical protein